MAVTSPASAPKRQRVAADGDAAQATIDLINAAAKKAEELAKKCRNVGFTQAGLQEPECKLRTLMERLALPEVLQLALAGTGNRSFQTVAMHCAPGADNDKGGAALLTKLMTITRLPGKDKWADTENDGSGPASPGPPGNQLAQDTQCLPGACTAATCPGRPGPGV